MPNSTAEQQNEIPRLIGQINPTTAVMKNFVKSVNRHFITKSKY